MIVEVLVVSYCDDSNSTVVSYCYGISCSSTVVVVVVLIVSYCDGSSSTSSIIMLMLW